MVDINIDSIIFDIQEKIALLRKEILVRGKLLAESNEKIKEYESKYESGRDIIVED